MGESTKDSKDSFRQYTRTNGAKSIDQFPKISIDDEGLERAMESESNQDELTPDQGLIDTLNSTVEAMVSASEIIEGIAGICDMAKKYTDEEEGRERLDKLTREAEELMSAFLKSMPEDLMSKAGIDSDSNLSELSSALENISMEGLKDIKIDFHDIESLTKAIDRIKSIKNSLDQTVNEIKSIADGIVKAATITEVMQENKESANTKVRDVRQAMEMAEGLALKIANNPKEALLAAGNLKKAKDLLS